MDLATFRKEKDAYFSSPESPLTDDQRPNFSGLKYFPENTALRLTLEIDPNVSKDFVMMQTSTGSQRRYVRAGKIHFTVDGQPAELTLYKDDHGFFLPFRDSTGKSETYEAGRYLEPEENEAGKVIVDFNLAYNPYCAYNEHFSCPLPPIENWLKVPIQAGEKRFHA